MTWPEAVRDIVVGICVVIVISAFFGMISWTLTQGEETERVRLQTGYYNDRARQPEP